MNLINRQIGHPKKNLIKPEILAYIANAEMLKNADIFAYIGASHFTTERGVLKWNTLSCATETVLHPLWWLPGGDLPRG